MDKEELLNELFELTQKEQHGENLTDLEKDRYVEIVDMLQTKGVEIPFGIEI